MTEDRSGARRAPGHDITAPEPSALARGCRRWGWIGLRLLTLIWMAGCAQGVVEDTRVFNPQLGTFELRKFDARGVAGIWLSAGAERAPTSTNMVTPIMMWPPRGVFERGRDTTVFLVFHLTALESAKIAGKISRNGERLRDFTSVVRPRTRVAGAGSERIHTYAMPLAQLPPGQYLVDVTVDGRVAGAYTFEVR